MGAGGCGAVAVVSGCWSGVSSGAGVVAGWSGEEVRWRVETSASGRPGPGRAAGAWGAAVAGAGVVDEVVDRRGAGTVTGSEVRAAPGWSPSGPEGGPAGAAGPVEGPVAGPPPARAASERAAASWAAASVVSGCASAEATSGLNGLMLPVRPTPPRKAPVMDSAVNGFCHCPYTRPLPSRLPTGEAITFVRPVVSARPVKPGTTRLTRETGPATMVPVIAPPPAPSAVAVSIFQSSSLRVPISICCCCAL
ncbi:hypothetical protein ACFQQB_61815 [Nonomuraea rubra]|uniref:hypothetical protein n=1 Tax=Nonomuraea rubra TaxID=46180 RepID=UPI003612A277